MDFAGALVLVTHDRYMLDRVSTTVLGLDGDGGAQLYADYSQWEEARRQRRSTRPAEPASEPAAPAIAAAGPRRKLSYIDQREWEQMESRIVEAETEIERLQSALQDPQVVTDGEALQRSYTLLQAAQSRVDELYARWAELEEKRG